MKRFSILLVLVATAAVHSCVRPPEDDRPVIPDRVEELKVPAGFDWKLTGQVVCDFTAPVPAVVSVALAPEAEPFATFTVGGDAEPMALSIPAGVKTLYVRYGEERTARPIEVVNGTLSAELTPSDAVAAAAPRDRLPGTIMYPAYGWGTLMFEDMWPSSGDFDFNDLVVGYRVQLNLQNKNKVEAMLVNLRVKAVGGSKAYDLYLRLDEVRGGQIDEIDPYYSFANADPGVAMTQLNEGDPVKDPAMFRFDRIKKNANKPSGAIYINTERGYEMSDDELTEVSYVVYFRNAISISKLSSDSFDWFIGLDQGDNTLKEIHLPGFEPTDLGEDLYESMAEADPNTDAAPDYYYSNKGFVWVIDVPHDIRHPYESVSILDAYPRFGAWVQSGGALYPDWYDAERVNGNLVND